MNLSNPTLRICFAAISLMVVSDALAQSPSYHRTAAYKLGGEGGWDYLISGPGDRLFISRGTHVVVMDENTGKVVGDIPGTTGVHGIAFSTKRNRGYTSNGRDNSVTEFDLTTLAVIKKIPVSGQNPDCIIFDGPADRVITANGRSGDVSVIDPASEKEVGKIQIGGKLEYMAADSKGRVFVNNETKSEIDEVDVVSQTLVKHWSIAPGEGPSGLAIDRKHHRLFSVTDGKMIVSDTVAGKAIATVEIGQGPDAAEFDEKLGLAFSSDGETGTLSVVKQQGAAAYSRIQTVQTQPGARTMALNAKTHKIFLAVAEMGEAPAGGGRRPAKPGSFTILVYAP